MNGYKNEATWRVAMQIEHTPELYQLAQRCREGTYLELLSKAPLEFLAGGVMWYDEALDVVGLNELVHDIRRGDK
jgi:hypothetical protein